jgi:hypothetical protein
MPMWGGYWGGPWAGFGWLFPAIGLLFMGLMMFLCCRMMGRTVRRGPEGSDAGHQDTEVVELRREVQLLREEVRRLRDRE